jgi:hypothetical protein
VKKVLLTILVAIFLSLITGSVIAEEWCHPSAVQTASAAVRTSAGIFHGILFVTDGTNAVTVNVYDNASAASGTKLIPTDTIITTSATNRLTGISIDPPVRYDKGIYVEITCSGTVAYMVYYKDD